MALIDGVQLAFSGGCEIHLLNTPVLIFIPKDGLVAKLRNENCWSRKLRELAAEVPRMLSQKSSYLQRTFATFSSAGRRTNGNCSGLARMTGGIRFRDRNRFYRRTRPLVL